MLIPALTFEEDRRLKSKMENSNNPSLSSVQDVAQSPEKKSLGNKSTKKMSPIKPNAAKMPAKAAKKQDATLKKSTSSNRTSTPNDSMDSLSGQGKAKTAMGIDLDSVIRLFDSAHAALSM